MKYRLSNAKTVLETTTTAAVLLVAALILGSFLATQFRKSAPAVHGGLTVGKNMSEIPGVRYPEGQRTILIALGTNCGYCEKSIPFYQELVRANERPNKSFKLVAVFPDRQGDVQEYLRNNKLNIEALSKVRLNELNIPGTPTLILIGPDHTVEDFWVGEISPPTQQRLLRMLTES